MPGVEQGSHEEFAAVRLIVLLAQEQLEFGHCPVSPGVPPHEAPQQVARARGDERRGLLQNHSAVLGCA